MNDQELERIAEDAKDQIAKLGLTFSPVWHREVKATILSALQERERQRVNAIGLLREARKALGYEAWPVLKKRIDEFLSSPSSETLTPSEQRERESFLGGTTPPVFPQSLTEHAKRQSSALPQNVESTEEKTLPNGRGESTDSEQPEDSATLEIKRITKAIFAISRRQIPEKARRYLDQARDLLHAARIDIDFAGSSAATTEKEGLAIHPFEESL